MKPQKTPAYLLKSVDYGESDRVVTLYTRQFGRIPAMARGARASKRRFACLQPFVLLEAELESRPNQELYLLRGVAPLAVHPALLADLDLLACGYRLLELTDSFEHEPEPSPECFDLLQASFERLDQGAPRLGLRLAFEAKLISLAGLAPHLDTCLVCAREIALGSAATLHFAQGGLACPRCQIQGQQAPLSPAGLAALRNLFQVKPAFREGREPAPSEVEGPASHEVERALESFIEYQLGRPLKAAAFEKSLRLEGLP